MVQGGQSHFYPYQITGAVGLVLKLLGSIDADKLFEASAGAYTESEMNKACGDADSTGFGKTKQCLLAALPFSTLPTKNKHNMLIVHRRWQDCMSQRAYRRG
jgi:hypothetical protein